MGFQLIAVLLALSATMARGDSTSTGTEEFVYNLGGVQPAEVKVSMPATQTVTEESTQVGTSAPAAPEPAAPPRQLPVYMGGTLPGHSLNGSGSSGLSGQNVSFRIPDLRQSHSAMSYHLGNGASSPPPGGTSAPEASCSVPNGTGTRNAAGACTAVACNTGFVLYIGACHAATEACEEGQGSGTHRFENGSYGRCTLNRCDDGFVFFEGSCHAPAQSCSVENGRGTRLFSNGQYGACAATSCNEGYLLEGGRCFAARRACASENGSGTQSFEGGGLYGACAATKCDNGFSLFGGSCHATARACDVPNGRGTQYFKDGGYGACAATACDEKFTLFQGACFATAKACDVPHGEGIHYFAGGSYGACTAQSCKDGFLLHAGACYADFSQKWIGFYSYKTEPIDHYWTAETFQYNNNETVMFSMESKQEGGDVSGTIIDILEPWTLTYQERPIRAAHFKGTITQDGDFDFVKTYDDNSWPFHNSVRYKGKINGGTSSGAAWTIQDSGVTYTGAATFAACKQYLEPHGRGGYCK